MLSKFSRTFGLLTKKNKTIVVFLALFRSLLGVLDLLGIVMLGFLLAKAANQISNDQSKTILSNFDFKNILSELSLLQLAIFTVIIFLSKSIFALATMRYMALRLAKVENEIIEDRFNKLLNSSTSTVDKLSKQEINYAATTSANSAITKLLTVGVTILSETILLVLIAGLFALVNFRITVAICLYFALIGTAMHKTVGGQYAKVGKQSAESMVASFSSVEDTVNSFREIKSLGKQEQFSSRFAKNRIKLAQSLAYTDYLSAVPRYIVESALMVGALALAAFSFRSGSTADAAALLGVFMTGGLRIMASMLPLQTSLGSVNQLLEQAKPFFNFLEVLDGENLETKYSNPIPHKSSAVGFEFLNVDYFYPESDYAAVKKLNFSVSPGEMIAFIGPSGSGKSTIADLISNMISPTVGEIKLNVVTGDFPKIGYVPQSPGLLSGTIVENITLNVDSGAYDREKVKKVLNLSHLKELVESLPDGIETSLGMQANSLSGGQLQRIGLARALYPEPGLIILDEATSALDADTEAAIAETLNDFRGKATIVVIAHRLATVKQADRVFVVADGEIVAEGKFADLMKSNELVARYVALSELSSD